MRDSAIGGLATLLRRPDWRDSDARPAIAERISAGLRDQSALVRMHAATAVRALCAAADPPARAAAIGELLDAEDSPEVRAVLVRELWREAQNAVDAVDAVVDRILDATDDAVPDTGDDAWRGLIALLANLALVHKTPAAARRVEQWCRHAPRYASAVTALIACSRDRLSDSTSDIQVDMFRLLGAAARSSLTRWTRDPTEHLVTNLPDKQLEELKGAAKVAHEITQQIYFASGAFDERQRKPRRAHGDLTVFANLAFPTLETCANLRLPQCIHRAVQTMIYLAPLDEPRALKAIANAVPADGTYASESLAGSDVMPYLHRLLAEHRTLVLHDDAGVVAFRHLLETFASAGNAEALALAYTFAEVFR